MKPKQAFKAAFLWRMADAGLEPDEAMDLLRGSLVKRAFIGSTLTAVGKGIGAGLSAAWQYLLPAALMAPPVIGAATGAALARMADIDERDVADIKTQELIEAYRMEAEAARRRRLARAYRRLRDATAAWSP